jgi:hypothetical protein
MKSLNASEEKIKKTENSVLEASSASEEEKKKIQRAFFAGRYSK